MSYVDLVNKLYTGKKPLYDIRLTVEVLKVDISFRLGNTRAEVTDFSKVRLLKCYAYHANKDKVAFQVMVAVKPALIIQEGDIRSFEGTLYNYGGIPCLGYEVLKPTRHLIPSKERSVTHTKPDFNLPIPVFTFYEENTTLLPIEAYPAVWQLQRLNIDTTGKNVATYARDANLKYQHSFGTLRDFINFPVIQVVNGTGQKDKVTSGLLDYITNGEWKAVRGILDFRGYNDGPKVIFCKREEDANLDFPIINMLSI